MWEKLKDRSCEIMVGLVLISLPLFFANSIVDQFITPKIIANLKAENYLREEIKEGRHITTDKVAFAENNLIKGEIVRNLNGGVYARVDDINGIADKVELLETSLQHRLEASSQMLAEANKEIAELNQVIRSLTSKSIKVTLFVSDLESDRGYVVLNINNRAISQIVENDRRYELYSSASDNDIKLKARVEPTTAEGYDGNASIGRLHREDYHRLFAGTRSGARVAGLRLE